MSRSPAHDILFEPVAIGPLTARNRFYQVPHCNGMGHRYPETCAAMRAVKAEGGWAVVCTEETEIHPSSDVSPHIEGRIWDDRDMPLLRLVADKVHEHGALAGVELAHNGAHALNLYSRCAPLGVSHSPVFGNPMPVQARRMDKQDIRDLRRWHRDAVERACRAGFDLVYVYAGHGLSIVSFFLSRRHNDRGDEYGGSLENRARLLRELVEDAREAAAGRCAVAVRIAMNGLFGEDGLQAGAHRQETEEIIADLAELPDLWDLSLAEWEHDSATARFQEEGWQEPFFHAVKQLTSKPVVGVGRYTSADRMASLVRRGVLDMIGAARPSIADPFLPRKIEEGRYEDICECIGCNICVAGDYLAAPMRCTQNPSMGEEWRRGWHPERIRPKQSDKAVLVVGSGPAGLEAARALGQRGYEVTLAEAGAELGGRAAREARLPGLASWIRVRDYRKSQLDRMANVGLYLHSRLAAADVLEYGIPRIAVATGCHWRRDGMGGSNPSGIEMRPDAPPPFTPDDLMALAAGDAEARPLPEGGRVLVWDDDHYYMAGVLAEWLALRGHKVCYVTAAREVSTWTRNTMEQHFIHKRLLQLGVEVRTSEIVQAVGAGEAEAVCGFTGQRRRIGADAIVLAAARQPDESLLAALRARQAEWPDFGIESVQAIGDALAPALIAHAVYDGRRYAEEMDMPAAQIQAGLFRREGPGLAPAAGIA